MALRVRKNGRIFCAALRAKEDGDIYIHDGIHYLLSVEAKVLVTEPHNEHMINAEWWWKGKEPADVKIDSFYYDIQED